VGFIGGSIIPARWLEERIIGYLEKEE
jgi:hypothetical protein